MPAARGRRLVTLVATPGQQFVDELQACWGRGDAVLPLDPAAPGAVTRRLVEAMRPDDPVDDGVALVIATSGSTGEPKGAQLSVEALEASARATHRRIGRAPDDVWLSCLPWQHIGGLQVMLRARLLGIPLLIHSRFDPAQIAACGATLVSLVPTQLTRLLDAGVDLSSFRTVLLGGAAAPRGLLERAAAAGVPVVTTYGMSETAGGCVYDGVPLDDVEVRITDQQRIAVRGPVLMTGYRRRPDLSAEALVDGWLVTHDRGRWASDGRLVVEGRADDLVVSGGENVSVDLVAETLRRHPALRDVAVVGVADREWGSRVVAVVVADSPVILDELREWCASRLPAAAVPRGLVTVGAIPLLPSGKPDRRRLAALAQATAR